MYLSSGSSSLHRYSYSLPLHMTHLISNTCPHLGHLRLSLLSSSFHNSSLNVSKQTSFNVVGLFIDPENNIQLVKIKNSIRPLIVTASTHRRFSLLCQQVHSTYEAFDVGRILLAEQKSSCFSQFLSGQFFGRFLKFFTFFRSTCFILFLVSAHAFSDRFRVTTVRRDKTPSFY